MALDPAKNFVKVEVAGLHDAVATSIPLISGDGAKLDDPASVGAYNMTWYDSTLFPDPDDDPKVEIVRVTALSADTLTIARDQESSGASTKNTGGSTYKMKLAPTAKLVTDIDNFLGFSLLGGWYKEDLAAGLSNSPLLRNSTGLSFTFAEICSYPGSIVGFSIRIGAAVTSNPDDATFQVFVSGVALSGFDIVMNDDSVLYKSNQAAVGTHTFVAGDRLDIRVTTGASFTPAGSIECIGSIEIVLDVP